MIPEFMAGCLKRDGDVLTPQAARASVEKIIYAEVTFDEEGDIMTMTEIYEITLQQEVLNEKSCRNPRRHHQWADQSRRGGR